MERSIMTSKSITMAIEADTRTKVWILFTNSVTKSSFALNDDFNIDSNLYDNYIDYKTIFNDLNKDYQVITNVKVDNENGRNSCVNALFIMTKTVSTTKTKTCRQQSKRHQR